MAEEAPAIEPNSEETGDEIVSVQRKKSKDSAKTLSTIPEETTSLPTVSSKTDHDDFSLSPTSSTKHPIETAEKPKVKTPLPPPKLPDPIPSREKKHTSAILKSSSRQTVVPHDRPRTLSMQERLLSHIQFAGKPLFPTVVGEQLQPAKTASILVTGFGLRNLASLQEALQIEEHNKLKQLYRAQDRQDQDSSIFSGATETTVSVHISRQKTESSSETQTDGGSTTWECPHKKKVMYLMGVHATAGEEEASKIELSGIQMEDGPEEVEPSLTESMKQAQKYLRVHRIFEFFQFIIAHLLSALPENPIEFIIDLLDKCLIFRAGLIEPPLLYGRNHLECLFYLMDKMRTGYIELDQYKTGMRTVGICKFNEKPFLTQDGMVTKEDFIEEAYDCLSHLLTDMVKRRWIRVPPPITPPPPPTPQISTAATSCTGEYPSNRFTKTHLFLDCV